LIDEERSDLLQSAIEFSEIKAQEIITHRVDLLAIDVNSEIDSILETTVNSNFSRFPVYEGSIDNILGMVHLNHLLKMMLDDDQPSIRSIITEILYIHQSKTLPVVMSEMQKRKIHMAVVIDDYGGTLGILTLEDILEQIVGEIWDENDVIRDAIVKTGDDVYEVDGSLGIYEFLEYFDVNDREFEENFVTMGGWAIDILDGFPKIGESFEYRNMLVTVTEMDDLRVIKMRVEIRPKPEQSGIFRRAGRKE
jgi:CBS domain containing-hemolysin-like protein